ncbi:elongin-C-like isoform X2 [Toxorhynchites rutilus septentrionalis]|uniref:elongin-C-like isoform X2 n=1 Tax=Toxorhynchites rutilus septentrionalis TaxID=329112 RepID=UPI002478BB80|nr:elongin-C-like isoform X2 [Toxorhynchites rutilus septentrionalis]
MVILAHRWSFENIQILTTYCYCKIWRIIVVNTAPETFNSSPRLHKSSLIAMEANTDPRSPAEKCVGPNSEFIKLVSAEGIEFFVARKHALISETIRGILACPGIENRTNTIHLKNISTEVLEDVIKFIKYKHYNRTSTGEFPDFIIKPDMIYELMIAANYLQL